MSSNPKDGEEIKFEMSEDGKDIKYSVDHEDDSGCRRETAKFSMGSNDFLATHWRTPIRKCLALGSVKLRAKVQSSG